MKASQISMSDAPSAQPAMDQATILVVDDDPVRLNGTIHLLEQAGYTVNGALSAGQALDSVAANQPNLILLDVVLPDMSGVEISQQLKRNPATSGIYIILLSGLRTSPDDKVSGLNAGADGYINRPVSNRELLAHVHAILRLRSAELTIRRYDREQQNQQERELHALDEYHGEQVTRLTAQMLGVEALSSTASEVFDGLVETYAIILDMAVDQRAYHVDHQLPSHLLTLAEQLGRLSAGPRDVIAIHRAAIRAKAHDHDQKKVQVYLEEARYLVLELMGYLVAFYRAYSTLAMRNARKASEDQG